MFGTIIILFSVQYVTWFVRHSSCAVYYGLNICVYALEFFVTFYLILLQLKCCICQ